MNSRNNIESNSNIADIEGQKFIFDEYGYVLLAEISRRLLKSEMNYASKYLIEEDQDVPNFSEGLRIKISQNSAYKNKIHKDDVDELLYRIRDFKGEDARPYWMKVNEVKQDRFEFQAETVPYTVLKGGLVPDLPGYLGCFRDRYLYISEEAPEIYRATQLVHEYVEFTVLNGKPDRCVESVKEELKYLPSEVDREDYLKYRITFFKNLHAMQNKLGAHEFVKEIKKSYDYLLQELCKYKIAYTTDYICSLTQSDSIKAIKVKGDSHIYTDVQIGKKVGIDKFQIYTSVKGVIKECTPEEIERVVE